MHFFVFGSFSPGVDNLQFHQYAYAIVNMHVCFYFHLKLCFEKDAFRQFQDNVMVVLPW